MNVARDAAAWALDDNFLFVFGGSLGKLNGYTDSVEMYHTVTGNWLEGPPMSSRGEFASIEKGQKSNKKYTVPNYGIEK